MSPLSLGMYCTSPVSRSSVSTKTMLGRVVGTAGAASAGAIVVATGILVTAGAVDVVGAVAGNCDATRGPSPATRKPTITLTTAANDHAMRRYIAGILQVEVD